MIFKFFSQSALRMTVSREFCLTRVKGLPGVLKWLPLLSRCLFQCLLLLLPFSSPRAYLSFTFLHHRMFVLIMLKLLFLVSAFRSLIRSQVFRFSFSMAEGGCEKFPDHWNTEFFWTVIVEYISHEHPVDILVKRWVTVRFFFSFFFSFPYYMT